MPRPFPLYLRFILVILFSIACAAFITRIEIRQNVQDMLPDSISKGDMEMLARLGLINRVFMTVEGPDFRTVSVSAERLGELLSREPVFAGVIYRVPDALNADELSNLMDMLPAIIDENDLAQIDSSIDEKAISAALEQDFLLLNSPAGLGLKKHIQRDPLGFIRFFFKKLELLKSGSRMQVRDGMFSTPDGRACMLWAETREALTDSANAEKVQKVIDAAIKKALLPGCSVTIIGPLPHTLANARIVNHDLRFLLSLATVAIIVLFLIFTRDLRSLLLVFVPLLSAPFAIVATGALFNWKISGIALAFGVVLIGIAVDFSVHIYMHMRCEAGAEGSSGILGKPFMRSIFMAYLTTAGVFVVLMFSQIPAHRQMAVLAIAGLTVALMLSIVIVPGIAAGSRRCSMQDAGRILTFNVSRRACRVVVFLWLLILVAGVIAWNHVRYNGDIRKFDVKSDAITRAERNFHRLWGTDLEQIMVVSTGASLDQALDLNDSVARWLSDHGIKGARSISVLLPGPKKQGANIEQWGRFWEKRLPSFKPLFISLSLEKGFSKDAFSPFFKWLQGKPAPFSPHEFLTTSAGSLLSGMIRGLDNPDGHVVNGGEKVLVITLIPSGAVGMGELQQIRSDLAGVHIFTGAGWKSEMETIMKRDIRQMCTGALLLVTCIVWFFFRSLRMVAAALVPVVSALCVMAIYTVVSSAEFNMMHLLMGIMVTGLSIDYGIFMARAVRDGHASSTLSAVVLCALSTISGFGILAFSHHPVLQSLGETVLAGIGASLPAALFVTPCIMKIGSCVKEAEE